MVLPRIKRMLCVPGIMKMLAPVNDLPDVDMEKFRDTELFDAAWYLTRYPDVSLTEMDPLDHFLRIGRKLGRQPRAEARDGPAVSRKHAWPAVAPASADRARALFCEKWYLNHNEDVARAWPRDPYLHFDSHGTIDRRRPNPFFDIDWYCTTVGPESPRNALLHYIEIGAHDGLLCNPFFASEWYKLQYMQGCPDWLTPLEHYFEVGRFTDASPHPVWDEQRYVKGNIGFQNQIAQRRFTSGYEHFCTFGWREAIDHWTWRVPISVENKTFDYEESLYLAENPDVARHVANGDYRTGLHHFFVIGYSQLSTGLRAPFSINQVAGIVSITQGKAEDGGKYIALFAHYDADGLVDEYVYKYLQSLRANDVDIIFITPKCRDQDLRELGEICRYVIIKNDAGRDFGSWHIALKHFGIDFFNSYNYLILANDSVYFPVNDPKPMFSAMPGKFDMWGIVDSCGEFQYHIQSWFLAFNAAARDKVLTWFIEQCDRNIYLRKWGQIMDYELGLTARARSQGMSVGAWCAVNDIREDTLHKPELQRWRSLASNISGINPSHHLWDLLLTHYQCPALKLELVRNNPLRLPNVTSYPEYLPSNLRKAVVAHANRQKDKVLTKSLPPVAKRQVSASRELKLVHDLPGQGGGGRRLVLLAHYDPDGICDPHVTHMMQSLADNDCDIVFITGSQREDCWSDARRLATRVLVKTDVARDFGSWFLGVRACDDVLKRYDSVIWMNDSIYFPLVDPAELFARMEEYDFWGLADSHLEQHHVMSWFWVFGREIVQKSWFAKFQKDFSPHYSKWEQIRNFEMRYPASFRNAGLSVGSWLNAEEIIAEAARQGNPLGHDANVLHDCWRLSVAEFRSPAIKVELMRDNPLAIDIGDILKVIGDNTIYDPRLIEAHLRRVKCGHILGRESHAA